MDEFIQASKQFNAKTIVRVTGDNPLTDPKIIDFMVEQHLKKNLIIHLVTQYLSALDQK